jgi:serine/threonine protein phosphatase PrpC
LRNLEDRLRYSGGMPSSTSLTVSVGAKTHTGARSENQDRISRADTPFGDLYVVADGVGGYQGGAQAAQAVVDGFALLLKSSGDLPLSDALQNAARSITADLRRRSEAVSPGGGMVSTVVLAVVNGNEAVIAHAGDSRAYKLRGGRLERLTRDHSVVERLIARGEITDEEAKSRSDSNVLTRAIGQDSGVTLDIGRTDLQPGDALLLCSDGLWGYASHQDIQAVAAAPNLSPQGVAETLLALALRGGGGDNISVQFLRFEAASEMAAAPRRGLTHKQTAIMVAAVVAGLALSGGTMAVFNKRGAIGHGIASAPPIELPSAPPAPDGAAAPRASITILTAEAADEPKWIRELSSLAEVNAKRATPNASCVALGIRTPALFATPAGLAKADAVRRRLGLPETSLIHLAAEKLSVCGEGDIFVLPARSTLPDRAASGFIPAAAATGAREEVWRDVAQTLLAAAPRLISVLLVHTIEARQECRARRLKPGATSSRRQTSTSQRPYLNPYGR